MIVTNTPLGKKLYHYALKAVNVFNMIEKGDRVLVCLSGGKDSYTMVCMLAHMQQAWRGDFELCVFTLDQGQPGFDDSQLRQWLTDHNLPFAVHGQDTYSIVTDKIPAHKTYCSLCSRLRRGIIYRYARENGFNKVALGHHRDDLNTSLLMSILYNGQIKSMPPKLVNDDGDTMVIRPLVYCQESDIKTYAQQQQFPIIPCNLCGTQENLVRQKISKLINELSEQNPKIGSNILHALGSVKPSQLMDQSLFDFKGLALRETETDTLET